MLWRDDVDRVITGACTRCIRYQTRWWSHTTRLCLSTSWLRIRTRRSVLTTRHCTTSASVHSNYRHRHTATSTTWSQSPCLESRLAFAFLDRCSSVISSRTWILPEFINILTATVIFVKGVTVYLTGANLPRSLFALKFFL